MILKGLVCFTKLEITFTNFLNVSITVSIDVEMLLYIVLSEYNHDKIVSVILALFAIAVPN